jgi:cell division septum initiation protein DivIVA
VANGRHLPLTSSVIVDQAEALEYIDQLRVTIPEEVKSARRVNAEVERLLEQARAEAEQILARAQEQATYLIEERELTRQAEEISQEMIRQAQADSAEVMRGADNYAAEVLAGLETEVMRTLKTIRRGLELLDERRAVPEEPEETEAEPQDGELDEYDQTGAAQTIRG